MNSWLFAFPLIAVLVHITEEFFYPGGFREWYIDYRPMVKGFLTNARLVGMNLTLVIAAASCAVTGARHGGTNTWMIVVSIVAWNSVFHITGAIRTHRYSPGMISAIALYLPLTFQGFFELVEYRQVTVGACVICFSVGTLYHFVAETEMGLKWIMKAGTPP